MGWLKKRFGEASTMAGLGVIGTSIQAYVQYGNNAAIATALAGLLAVLMPEGGPDGKK